MVRGPLPSGRAPAHLSVLPGGAGAGGLDDLEDDRTTIEPGPPADEAPTPIAAAASLEEQWEDGTTVAEQSSSSKRNAVVEESTIEDQAKPLPPLHLVPPPQPADPASAAKLVVVGGPDQGRVFDLRSGSEVRIGRAVDNDVVLTDIAVSRKHLVLSWDGAAWVVHDNGSGNGTLINDRLEDGRCQLHHADRVEIGNTVLRFDHLPSAHQPSLAGWGQRDEEAATVAGKAPVRASQVAAAAAPEHQPRHRPASVTAPVRDRTAPPRKKPGATEPPPPPAAPRPRAGTTPPPPPRSTAAAAVVPPPSAHAQHASPQGAPRVLTAPPSAPIPSGTLTGAPSAPVPMPMSGPYTQPMPGPPQFSPFSGGVRPMTTTAQVEPRSYAMSAPQFAMQPPPRRRQRLWLGIGAVSLIAIVATGAVLGGGDPKPTTATTVPAPAPASGTDAPDTDKPGVLAAVGEPTPETGSGSGSGSGSAAALVAPTPEVVPAPTPEVAVPAPTPAPEVAVTAPTPTPEVAVPTPTPPPPPVVDRTPAVDRTPTRPVDRTPAVDRTPTRPVVRTNSPGRSLDIDTPTAAKPAAGTKALAAATKKADGQYRAKDWKGAAATLREAIGTSTEPEVKAMKARAADYDAIGNNLTAALGMSSARSTEALSAYKKAMAADRRAGAAHQQFLRDKIGDVAPNAAASYMVKQNYELAKSAADDAVNVGAGGNARIEGVRTSLERRAGEFYATAVKLQKSKPEDAKGLARRITKMVPASSPWYAKAIKLLNASSGRSDDDE